MESIELLDGRVIEGDIALSTVAPGSHSSWQGETWTYGALWFAVVLSPIAILWFLSWDVLTRHLVLWSAGIAGVWVMCWFLKAIMSEG